MGDITTKVKNSVDMKVVVSAALGVALAGLLATLLIKSAIKPLQEIGKAVK